MNTLYDSDSFIVVHIRADVPPAPADGRAEAQPEPGLASGHGFLGRHGFEIVDKRTGKEVYLDGLWAELFQQRIAQWQESAPTQDEVEEALAGFAELAQNPVLVH